MTPRLQGPLGSNDGVGATAAGPADMNDVPAVLVERFAASMPIRYRVLFDSRAIRRHASIVYRRIGKLAHVGVWRTLPDGTALLCIVADDRLGLLSLIAAVLASHRLSVVNAHLFSRPTVDGREAVDLFWVHRVDALGDAYAFAGDAGILDAEEEAAIGSELRALVAGKLTIPEIAQEALLASVEDAAASVVRFEDNDDDGAAVLTVEGPDGQAMLLVIAQTLAAQGAQIVRSLVRTVEGRVHNRFDLVELDGSAPDAKRRAGIRAAVAAALAQRAVRPPRG
jgi:UTP:GlnB (protein PII) uridylyltransferase